MTEASATNSTTEQHPRRTWRQWSKLARVRIGFVLMLIVAISAFAAWLPRRNMLAVRMAGVKVSDDHLRYRIDVVMRACLPFSVWGKFLPWLEENSGLLSTDGQIANIDLPDADVSVATRNRLRNFPRLVGAGVCPRHLGTPLDSLASLDKLSFVWITGLQANSDLGELRRLPHLEHLWLSKPSATGGGWKNLRDLPALKHLGLDRASSCTALKEIGPIPALGVLRFQYCRIQDDDLRALSGCPRLRNFSASGSSAIGAAGMKYIANCTSLETVTMTCSANEEELQVLAALTKLKSLDVRGSIITQAGIDRLKTAMPNCNIRWP